MTKVVVHFIPFAEAEIENLYNRGKCIPLRRQTNLYPNHNSSSPSTAEVVSGIKALSLVTWIIHNKNHNIKDTSSTHLKKRPSQNLPTLGSRVWRGRNANGRGRNFHLPLSLLSFFNPPSLGSETQGSGVTVKIIYLTTWGAPLIFQLGGV